MCRGVVVLGAKFGADPRESASVSPNKVLFVNTGTFSAPNTHTPCSKHPHTIFNTSTHQEKTSLHPLLASEALIARAAE